MLTLYPRKTDGPLRVAVLCSHRAPGLLQLLAHPQRGEQFDVVACISSEHDFIDREAVTQAGVPTFVHDIHDFYRSWNAPHNDLDLRRTYDAGLVQRLAIYDVDVVILCSYLYIVTHVVLEAYPNRVVNIHHSDLPGYPGLHAVRDAIVAGEKETRATAHLVTRELDAGPPLVRSWAFPVHPMVEELRTWKAERTLKAYAFAHQEWMIESTWAPLMSAVIDMFLNADLAAHELEPPGRTLRSLQSMRATI